MESARRGREGGGREDRGRAERRKIRYKEGGTEKGREGGREGGCLPSPVTASWMPMTSPRFSEYMSERMA